MKLMKHSCNSRIRSLDSLVVLSHKHMGSGSGKNQIKRESGTIHYELPMNQRS